MSNRVARVAVTAALLLGAALAGALPAAADVASGPPADAFTGRLVDIHTGSPIAGVTVRVGDTAGVLIDGPRALSGADGRFTLRDTPDEEYHVRVNGSAVDYQTGWVAFVPPGPLGRPVVSSIGEAVTWSPQNLGDIALRPTTFSGRLRDSVTGDPVAGATVRAAEPLGPLGPGTLSGADGRFVLHGVPEEEYHVEIFGGAVGYEDGQVGFVPPNPFGHPVVPEPFAVTWSPQNLGDIALDRPGTMDVTYVSVGTFGDAAGRFRAIDFLLDGTVDEADHVGYLECDDDSYVISLHAGGRVEFSRGPRRTDPSASSGPGAILPAGLAAGEYIARLSCEVTPPYRGALGSVVRHCVRVTVPAAEAPPFSATDPPGAVCPLDLAALLGDSVITLRASVLQTLLGLRGSLVPIALTAPPPSTTTTKPKSSDTTPPGIGAASATPKAIYNDLPQCSPNFARTSNVRVPVSDAGGIAEVRINWSVAKMAGGGVAGLVNGQYQITVGPIFVPGLNGPTPVILKITARDFAGNVAQVTAPASTLVLNPC